MYSNNPPLASGYRCFTDLNGSLVFDQFRPATTAPTDPQIVTDVHRSVAKSTLSSLYPRDIACDPQSPRNSYAGNSTISPCPHRIRIGVEYHSPFKGVSANTEDRHDPVTSKAKIRRHIFRNILRSGLPHQSRCDGFTPHRRNRIFPKSPSVPAYQ